MLAKGAPGNRFSVPGYRFTQDFSVIIQAMLDNIRLLECLHWFHAIILTIVFCATEYVVEYRCGTTASHGQKQNRHLKLRSPTIVIFNLDWVYRYEAITDYLIRCIKRCLVVRNNVSRNNDDESKWQFFVSNIPLLIPQNRTILPHGASTYSWLKSLRNTPDKCLWPIFMRLFQVFLNRQWIYRVNIFN